MFGEQIKNYLTRKSYVNYYLLVVPSFPIFNLLICILLSLSIKVFPQQNRFKFEHITIQEGLNDNQVYCIGQDKKGFMWVGTPSGLHRFDGYNIKVYSNIPHYGRTPIFEDDNGSS